VKEFIITHEPDRIRSFIKQGIEGSSPDGRFSIRPAVPSRMGQLQDTEYRMITAESFSEIILDVIHQTRESFKGTVIQQELTGVGFPSRKNSGRLKPDQAAPPSGVAAVAASGQFARRTVRLTVITFHGLDGETIPNRPPFHGQ
jgi:hypothetical protein